tara:strand:+ start:289 stop:711 length:423 start_codon:yes stop_codon:yes gene_type:complete
MSCPVCDKRTQQGLADCEKQREKLQSNNQRLTIVLAILGTLVGKETFDYAVGLSESVEQAITQETAQPSGSKSLASSVRTPTQGNEILLVQSQNVSLFPDLPALTPTLGQHASLEPIFLPEVGPMMLFGLMLTPSRKRTQ